MTKPNPAARFPKRQHRVPGDYGPGHLKVDNLLRDEDRDAYYALLRKPATTWRDLWRFLRERGYRIGSGAVREHRRQFREKLGRLRESAEMSLVCAELVRQVGANRMSDAAVLRFETLLTETLFERRKHKAPDDIEWTTLGRALTHAVTNRLRVEQMRLAEAESKREAKDNEVRGRPKAFDATAASTKVRRILGMPVPGEVPRALPAPASVESAAEPPAPARAPPPPPPCILAFAFAGYHFRPRRPLQRAAGRRRRARPRPRSCRSRRACAPPPRPVHPEQSPEPSRSHARKGVSP